MAVALGFLNGWLLWALPLAAIPIVIHLLNKRRYQRVKWAAMEFLLAAMKRNRRRMRMEQWLILALRTLAVILLVLAVTRPRLDEISLGGVHRHHLVCVDDSASMAHRSGVGDAFTAALDAVQDLASRLSETRPGDLFTLIRASEADRPRMSAVRIGTDLQRRVREETSAWRIGESMLDAGALLAAASRQLAANPETQHADYHVVTDLRARDWLTDDGRPNTAVRDWLVARDPQREHVTLVAVGSDDVENLGVTGLGCRDRVCTAGLPLRFGIAITNQGLDETPECQVAVEIDGRSRLSYPVPPLGAGESTELELAQTFHSAGEHSIVASLPGDRFPTDDRRSFAFHVAGHSRVLLVDGDPGDSLEESETFFLHAALEIRGAVDSGIEVRLIADHELAVLSDGELAEFDMVWLANIARPDDRTVARLENFARTGGGLVFFLGNAVDTSRYNEVLWRNGNGLFPCRLLDVRGDVDRPEPVHLAGKDDPVFATDTQNLEFMFQTLVRIGRWIGLDLPPGGSGQVLLRMTNADGDPLLAARDFDRGGRVFVCATSADTQWNFWARTMAFPITMLQLHRTAARPQVFADRNLNPVDKLVLKIDPGRHAPDVVVTPQTGDSLDVRTFSATSGTGGAVDLAIPMQELQGYGVFAAARRSHSGETERLLFARNPFVEEGVLRKLGPGVFVRAYPPELADRLTVVSHAETQAAPNLAMAGGGLWRLLAFGLLVGLLLETVLAWRFGRR
jgi:hypothetical protein